MVTLVICGPIRRHGSGIQSGCTRSVSPREDDGLGKASCERWIGCDGYLSDNEEISRAQGISNVMEIKSRARYPMDVHVALRFAAYPVW